MAEQFVNVVPGATQASLVGTITSGATSLVVSSGTVFPSAAQFRVLVESELMLVTAVSGTTFTVSRGQEGTTAAAHTAGVAVAHILTAAALAQLKADALNTAQIVAGGATSDFLAIGGPPTGADTVIPAQTGTIRLPASATTVTTNGAIIARRGANVGQDALLIKYASDIDAVMVGAGQTSGVRLHCAGNMVFVSPATFYFAGGGSTSTLGMRDTEAGSVWYTCGGLSTGPITQTFTTTGQVKYVQTDTAVAGATGNTLLFQAQNATGTGTTKGGSIEFAVGTGTTAGDIKLTNVVTQTAAPSAGGGSALPATPAGYVNMTINGTVRKIAYY